MYKVTAPGVWRIRSDHTTSADIVQEIKDGDMVRGDTHWQDSPHPKELWLHVFTVNEESVPENSWMAIIHEGKLVYQLPE